MLELSDVGQDTMTADKATKFKNSVVQINNHRLLRGIPYYRIYSRRDKLLLVL
jgi:hypothetical protein